MWKVSLVLTAAALIELNECKHVEEEELNAAVVSLTNAVDEQTTIINSRFDDATTHLNGLFDTSSANIDGQLTTLTTELSDVETAITEYVDSIPDISNTVNVIKSSTTTINENVNNIESVVTTISSNVATANDNLNLIENKVNDIDGDVNLINDNVNTISSIANAIQKDTTTIDGKVDVIDSNVDEIETQIKSVETALSGAILAINTIVTGIESKVDIINTNTDEAETLSNDIITALSTFVTELNDRLNTLQQYTEQTAAIQSSVTLGFSDLKRYVGDQVIEETNTITNTISTLKQTVNTRHDTLDESFINLGHDLQQKYDSIIDNIETVQNTLQSGIVLINGKVDSSKNNIKLFIETKYGSSAKSEAVNIDEPNTNVNNIKIEMRPRDFYILISVAMAAVIVLKCCNGYNSGGYKYKPIQFDDSQSDVENINN